MRGRGIKYLSLVEKVDGKKIDLILIIASNQGSNDRKGAMKNFSLYRKEETRCLKHGLLEI